MKMPTNDPCSYTLALSHQRFHHPTLPSCGFHYLSFPSSSFTLIHSYSNVGAKIHSGEQ